LLTSGVMTNSWDAANRLTAVSGSPSTSFAYDGLGNRTSMTVGGATTRYALDVAGGLPEVIAATGGATTHYLQVQGQVLAQYDSGTWGYVAPDALGSVRQVVNSAGSVTLAQSYDPFGNALEVAGSAESEFGYTGEQVDASTGLVYLRARYYSSSTGRFLSRDPVSSEPPYQYVGGNPIRYIDPSGYIQCNPDGYCPEIDRWLCLDPQGNWRGAYVAGHPCIVNPENVQTGNYPSHVEWVHDPCNPNDPEDYAWQYRSWCRQTGSQQSPRGLGSSYEPISGSLGSSSQSSLIPDGYLEGAGGMFGGAAMVLGIFGREVVYDFQTMERGVFTYRGHANWLGSGFGTTGLCTTLAGASFSPYAGLVWGFTHQEDGLRKEYSGPFWVAQGGIDAPFMQPFVNAGGGVAAFSSVIEGTALPDAKIRGVNGYADVSWGFGIQDIALFAGGVYLSDYEMIEKKSYENISQMVQDIRTGSNSLPLSSIDATGVSSAILSLRLAIAQLALLKYQGASFP
jgi:RHS repeat-associated protein